MLTFSFLLTLLSLPLLTAHTPGATCEPNCAQLSGQQFDITGIRTDPEDGDPIDYIFKSNVVSTVSAVFDPTLTVLAGSIVTFSLSGFDQAYPLHFSFSDTGSLTSPVSTIYPSSTCGMNTDSASWYPKNANTVCNLTWYIPTNTNNNTKAYYRSTAALFDLTGKININSSSLNTSVTTAPPGTVPVTFNSSSSSSTTTATGSSSASNSTSTFSSSSSRSNVNNNSTNTAGHNKPNTHTCTDLSVLFMLASALAAHINTPHH